MGSSSTGQRHEIIALNTATNSTSILTPGCRSAGAWTVFELVREHIPPCDSMAAKPLQTQAGPSSAAAGPSSAARPDPAAEEECSQQP